MKSSQINWPPPPNLNKKLINHSFSKLIAPLASTQVLCPFACTGVQKIPSLRVLSAKTPSMFTMQTS